MRTAGIIWCLYNYLFVNRLIILTLSGRQHFIGMDVSAAIFLLDKLYLDNYYVLHYDCPVSHKLVGIDMIQGLIAMASTGGGANVHVG